MLYLAPHHIVSLRRNHLSAYLEHSFAYSVHGSLSSPQIKGLLSPSLEHLMPYGVPTLDTGGFVIVWLKLTNEEWFKVDWYWDLWLLRVCFDTPLRLSDVGRNILISKLLTPKYICMHFWNAMLICDDLLSDKTIVTHGSYIILSPYRWDTECLPSRGKHPLNFGQVLGEGTNRAYFQLDDII